MRNNWALEQPQHYKYLYGDVVMGILLSFVDAALLSGLLLAVACKYYIYHCLLFLRYNKKIPHTRRQPIKMTE
jgi:hypothetical protein